jgi:hypothetical protein
VRLIFFLTEISAMPGTPSNTKFVTQFYLQWLSTCPYIMVMSKISMLLSNGKIILPLIIWNHSKEDIYLPRFYLELV